MFTRDSSGRSLTKDKRLNGQNRESELKNSTNSDQVKCNVDDETIAK